MKQFLIVASIVVSGCSSFGSDKVAQLDSLIAAGRCNDAYALANSTNDPVKFNNMGVVAINCERNATKARSYFEYGARNGEQNAIGNLLRNGWEVPSPDIRAANDARRAASDAELGGAIQLLQAAQPKFYQQPSGGGIPRFLKRSYTQQGSQMCAYDDGSVINIGVGICQLSIR